MLSVDTMLNLVKENHDIKSDRQLAKALEVTNLSPYRSGNAVFKDETALKIAKMSGLLPELVLSSCKGAVAKKKADVESQKVWERMFKMSLGSASIMLMITMLSGSPSIAKADALSFVKNSTTYILCDIVNMALYNNIYRSHLL